MGNSVKSEADQTASLMAESATEAASFLKAVSHEGRLLILCYLRDGEKTVSELEKMLSMRQAAVSQQLSRLRQQGLISPRRDGKTIYYSICDDKAQAIVSMMYDLFCKPED